MALDLERIRSDTPACANVLFLSTAGSSLMPEPVYRAQFDYLDLETRVGGYRALELEIDRVENSYTAIAKMLNCHPDEIAITENATVSWNMAFHAINFKRGDRVLTAETEYASNYISYLRLREKIGIEIIPIKSNESGELDVSALREAIDDRVKVIAVTHVPTNGGVVNPAKEIGTVAREAGIPYILDACQSAGQIELDVEDIGCDILTASGRKFLRAPRGTGFLYVRRSFLDKLDPPFLDMHGAEWVDPDRYTVLPNARRFENWEFNYAAVVGLGVAVDYALDIGMNLIERRTRGLAGQLRTNLRTIRGMTVHDMGKDPCGIVTFSHERVGAIELKSELLKRDILVTVSRPYGTRLDSVRRNLPDMVRASPHYFNSEQEIELFTAAVSEVIGGS